MIKILLKAVFTVFFVGGFLALIAYVLYKVDLIIGIVFMIVLALVTGFLAVKIKMRMEEKKIQTDIPDKIEKQKYDVRTKDIHKIMTTDELNKNLKEDLRKKAIQSRKQDIEEKRKELEQEMQDIQKQLTNSPKVGILRSRKPIKSIKVRSLKTAKKKTKKVRK